MTFLTVSDLHCQNILLHSHFIAASALVSVPTLYLYPYEFFWVNERFSCDLVSGSIRSQKQYATLYIFIAYFFYAFKSNWLGLFPDILTNNFTQSVAELYQSKCQNANIPPFFVVGFTLSWLRKSIILQKCYKDVQNVWKEWKFELTKNYEMQQDVWL